MPDGAGLQPCESALLILGGLDELEADFVQGHGQGLGFLLGQIALGFIFDDLEHIDMMFGQVEIDGRDTAIGVFDLAEAVEDLDHDRID